MAKNKLSRGIRVQVDDSGGVARDLSSDLLADSVSGLGFTAGEVDLTGASNAAGNYLADRQENTLTMKFHANNTANTGASTVLNGIIGRTGTVTVQIGAAGAAPAAGDPEFEGEFTCMGAPMAVEGGKLVHTVTFRPGSATAPAWGSVA